MSDEQPGQKSEADAELEREIRAGRKFSVAEAIGRLAGPGMMKGVSPIAPQQQGAAWHATLARVTLPAPLHAQLLTLESQMYRNDQSMDAAASAAAVRRWIERSWRQTPAAAALHTARSARHG